MSFFFKVGNREFKVWNGSTSFNDTVANAYEISVKENGYYKLHLIRKENWEEKLLDAIRNTELLKTHWKELLVISKNKLCLQKENVHK